MSRDLYRDLVYQIAEEEGVYGPLAESVIAQGSSWDPNAVSPAGAQGLMQLTDQEAMDLDVENPLDPEESIRGGIRKLRYSLEASDDNIDQALLDFNPDPGYAASIRSDYLPGFTSEYESFTEDVSSVPPSGGYADEDVSDTRMVFLPDNTWIDAPSDMSDERALELAKEKYPSSFESPGGDVGPPEGDSSAWDAATASASRSVHGLIPALQAGWAMATGDEELHDQAQGRLREESEVAAEYAPNLVTTEEIGDVYEEEGLLPAIGKVFEFGTEQIFQSFGFQAPSFIAGAGAYGATAAALAIPAVAAAAPTALTAGVAATLAFTGTALANYFGNQVERGYEEGKVDTKDFNLAKQLSLAGGQAALDSLTYMLALGTAGTSMILSKSAREAGFGAVGTLLTKLDNVSPLKRILAVVAEEEVAEMGQTALERTAAGLPISPFDEEARHEYVQIALATLAPAIGFGGLGAASSSWTRAKARKADEGTIALSDELRAEKQAVIDAERKIGAEEAAVKLGVHSADLREERDAVLQSLKGQAAVTQEDIHNLAKERNISSDDLAFHIFSRKTTKGTADSQGSMDGQAYLDGMSQEQLQKMYAELSVLPVQDHQTRFQIATDEEVRSVANNLGKSRAKRLKVTRKNVKNHLLKLGNIDPGKMDSQFGNELADHYMFKMAELGLAKRVGDDTTNIELIKRERNQFSKQDYDKVLDASRKRGKFLNRGQVLSLTGIRNAEVYRQLREEAVLRKDISEKGELRVAEETAPAAKIETRVDSGPQFVVRNDKGEVVSSHASQGEADKARVKLERRAAYIARDSEGPISGAGTLAEIKTKIKRHLDRVGKRARNKVLTEGVGNLPPLEQAAPWVQPILRTRAKEAAESAVRQARKDIGSPEKIGRTYTVAKEEGFLVREDKIGANGRVTRSSRKGFYPERWMADTQKRQLDRGRVGSESMGGTLRPEFGGEAAKAKRIREEPQSIVDEHLPLPAPPPDQESRFAELEKRLNAVMETSGLSAFRVKLIRALVGDDLGSFEAASGILELSMLRGLESKSIDEQVEALLGTLNHERIHILRKQGLITKKEWKQLTKWASKKELTQQQISNHNASVAKEIADLDEALASGQITEKNHQIRVSFLKPLSEGATYLDEARIRYGYQGYVDNWIDDSYAEEAVAALAADTTNAGELNQQPEVKGIFRKIAATLKRIGNALRGLGYNTPQEVLTRLYGDQMAERVRRGRALDTWWTDRSLGNDKRRPERDYYELEGRVMREKGEFLPTSRYADMADQIGDLSAIEVDEGEAVEGARAAVPRHTDESYRRAVDREEAAYSKATFDEDSGTWSDGEWESVGDFPNTRHIELTQHLAPSLEELRTEGPGMHTKIQRELVGENRSIPEGTPVRLRIDVKLWEKWLSRIGEGKYAQTIHDILSRKGRPVDIESSTQVGAALGYDNLARLDGEVDFKVNWDKSNQIKYDGVGKTPIAVVEGGISQDRTSPIDIPDFDSWIPVGYNPHKAVFFYDKRTGEEVVGGRDAISIGNTVFVREAYPGDRNVQTATEEGDKQFALDAKEARKAKPRAARRSVEREGRRFGSEEIEEGVVAGTTEEEVERSGVGSLDKRDEAGSEARRRSDELATRIANRNLGRIGLLDSEGVALPGDDGEVIRIPEIHRGSKMSASAQRSLWRALGLPVDSTRDTTEEFHRIYPLEEVFGTTLEEVDAKLRTYLDSIGFTYRMFGPRAGEDGKAVWPDFRDESTPTYEDGVIWIFDPREEGYTDAPYTLAWRVTHELGHARVNDRLTREFDGRGRRGGAMGEIVRGPYYKGDSALTLADALRAIEWEHETFPEQRRILEEEFGVRISDEGFLKENSRNIGGAVIRALTGQFADVGGLGLIPEVVNTGEILSSSEDLVRGISDEINGDTNSTLTDPVSKRRAVSREAVDLDIEGVDIPQSPDLSDISDDAKYVTAAGILDGSERVELEGTGKGGRPVIKDVATYFAKRVQDRFGGPMPLTNETSELVAQVLAYEAAQAYKQDTKNVDWYGDEIQEAIEFASLLHPELATNDDARFIFTAFLAILSNGQRVNYNAKVALKSYDEYQQTGLIPESVGTGKSAEAIDKQFALLDKLISTLGMRGAKEFMHTEFSVAELNAMGLKVPGELSDEVVYGSMIFGPKIGAFYQNLNGNFEPLTMDRWFMRTVGRMTGRIINLDESKIEAPLTKFVEVASENPEYLAAHAGVDVDSLADSDVAIEAANKLYTRYARNNFPKSERIPINLAAKAINSVTEPVLAPASGRERKWLRQTSRLAQRILKETAGIDMPNAVFQSLLWYPEKDLVVAMNAGRPSKVKEDYSDALERLAREGGIDEAEILRAKRRVSRRGKPRYAGRAGAPRRTPSRFTGVGSRLTLLEVRRLIEGQGEVGDKGGIPEPYGRRTRATPSTLRRLGFSPDVTAEVLKPTIKIKNRLKAAEIPAPVILEISGEGAPREFRDAILAAKAANQYGASVYIYDESDYSDMRLFLTEDKQSGIALKGEDIVSGFSVPGAPTGSIYPLMLHAIAEGGRRADAFDTVLPFLYANLGMKVVARDKWNAEYVPPGWRYRTFGKFNKGRPDVVYMIYDPLYQQPYEKGDGEMVGSSEEAVAIQDRELDLAHEVPTKRSAVSRDAEGATGVTVEASQFHGKGRGESVTFTFARNTEQAPDMGERFGQHLEPAGRYVNESTTPADKLPPGWESGEVTFRNPLYIDWGDGYESASNWKRVLSDRYGGFTGKELSRKIAADGYDGIVVVDPRGHTGEIVDLTSFPTPRAAEAPVFANPTKRYAFSRELDENADKPLRKPDPSQWVGDASDYTWGTVVLDAEGKRSGKYKVVIKQGHNEQDPVSGKRKGFGALHLEAHNKDISENTPFPNWEKLLAEFLNETSKRKKFGGGDIVAVSSGNGRMTFLWDRKDFGLPVVVVMDFITRDEQGPLPNVAKHYSVVTAFASNSFEKNMPNSNRQGHSPLIGRNSSTQAFKAFNNPARAKRFTESMRGRLAVDRTDGVPYTPAQREAQADLNGTSLDGPTTLWQRVANSFPVMDEKWFSYLRRKIADKYDRLRDLGIELTKQGLSANEMASASAHALALMVDKAGAFQAASLKYGVMTYEDGIARVKPMELVNDATVLVYDKDTDDFVERSYSVPGMYEGNGGMLSILEILANPNKNLVPKFFAYERALRGLRLKNAGKTVPMSLSSIKVGLAFAEEHPEIAIAHANLQAWNEGMVKFLQDTGVLTPEMAAVWLEHSDYTPFYLNLDGESTEAMKDLFGEALGEGADFTIIDSLVGGIPSPKYKGVKGELMEPVDAISRNSFALITSGLKNIAMQKAVDDAAKVGWAHKLTDKEVKAGQTVVTVRRNGKEEHYFVDDPVLFDTLVGAFDGVNPVLEAFGKPATWLREMVTRSPEFMAANLLRDSLSIWIVNDVEGFVPVKDSLATFGKSLKNWKLGEVSETYKMLEMHGAIGGYDLQAVSTRAVERMFLGSIGKKKNALGALNRVWDAAGEISALSEAAGRERVYEHVLLHSLDELAKQNITGDKALQLAMREASFQAMEILNFSRRGSSVWLKFVTSTVPFLNARIIGLDRLGRSAMGVDHIRGLTRKQAITSLAMRGGLLSLMTMAYTIMNWDDDEYQNMRPEVRDDYWLIPTGLGKFISIPIPFEAGVLFKVIPEHLTRLALGEQPREAVAAAKHALTATLNFNPIPQFAKPALEGFVNYNFFTGKPIVPFYMEDMIAGKQARPTTSAPAKALGELFNISPLKIENFIRGQFGTLGTWSMQAVDAVTHNPAFGYTSRPMPRATDLPFFKRFVRDEFGQGKKSLYYDLRNEVDGIVNTVNFLSKHQPAEALEVSRENRGLLRMKTAVNAMDRKMKVIRDRKTAIYMHPTMSRSTKRQMIDNLERMETKLLRNVGAMRRMADMPWL